MISASSCKGLTIVVWVLQVLTGCLFLFAGASKLFGVAEMVNFFAQVGFGQWLRYFFGVLEVGSAVTLFFPRQAFYGAVVLCVSLVGHIVIHAAVLHRPAAFLAFLLAVTLVIAYLRRPSANAGGHEPTRCTYKVTVLDGLPSRLGSDPGDNNPPTTEADLFPLKARVRPTSGLPVTRDRWEHSFDLEPQRGWATVDFA